MSGFCEIRYSFLVASQPVRLIENIPLSNFAIDFLRNQLEFRKSLTYFVSQLSSEWYNHFVWMSALMWGLVIQSKHAQSVVRFRACACLPKQRRLKIALFQILQFITFTVIYSFLGFPLKRRPYNFFFWRTSAMVLPYTVYLVYLICGNPFELMLNENTYIVNLDRRSTTPCSLTETIIANFWRLILRLTAIVCDHIMETRQGKIVRVLRQHESHNFVPMNCICIEINFRLKPGKQRWSRASWKPWQTIYTRLKKTSSKKQLSGRCWTNQLICILPVEKYKHVDKGINTKYGHAD